jgi:hypothetical protein
LRGARRQVPWGAAAACLAVFVVQGLGLFAVGADRYVGRAWGDEFNYTAMAQFLVDKPFSTDNLAANAHQPWLVDMISLDLKSSRIGQFVLQGFFAVSSGGDAKPLFQPTALLGPALAAVAVFALARRCGLGRGWAAATGAAAGMLPALAYVQLESFLSQSLGTPLLLLAPLLVEELNDGPSARTLGQAALLLAAAASVYTEFWPFFAGVGVLGLALAFPRHPRRWRLLACHGLVLAAPLALNPGFTPGFFDVFNHVGWTFLGVHYPFAFSPEGVTRLWVGDWAVTPRPALQDAFRAYAVAATTLALLGLFKNWLLWPRADCGADALPSGGATGRPSRAFAACLLALAFLPLLIFVHDDRHAYQFYKTLLSVSPLFPLGLALLWGRGGAAHGRPGESATGGGGPAAAGWARATAAAATVVAVLVSGAVASGRMSVAATGREPVARCYRLLNDPEVAALQDRLRRMPPANLVLAFHDPCAGYLNSWVSYFGRRHRIWMTDPRFCNNDLERHPEIGPAVALGPDAPPADALFLTCQDAFQDIDGGDLKPTWPRGKFQLWKRGEGAWALPLGVANPNGLESEEGRPYFWAGQGETTVEVLAGAAGDVTLRGDFSPGPSLPETGVRRLRVRTSGGFEDVFVTSGGPGEITVPVAAGKTTVTLEPLDRPSVPALPSGDARPLLLRVSDLSFRFVARGAGPRGKKPAVNGAAA